MEDSILKSVKMKLNLDPEQTDFDEVVVDHINTAFMSLHQLGVGPASGFAISDANNTWGEFLVGNDPRFSAVRTYVGHVVRLAFDPPDNSYTLNALKDMIREHEWRLEINANPAPEVNWYEPTPTEQDNYTGQWWDLTGLTDFPAEAPVGSMGYDSDTGKVWKKIS